jgi:hypothetical protein
MSCEMITGGMRFQLISYTKSHGSTYNFAKNLD